MLGINLNESPPRVESFCTLDIGGSLEFDVMSGTAIGFVKIGNLLSLGVGQATAKGLLEYVEDVSKWYLYSLY